MPSKTPEQNREYQRRWREKNRKLHRQRVLANRKKKLKLVADLKAGQRCRICGEEHPACLDFHHKDPGVKEAGISVAARASWGVKRLQEEIAKCEILCSNCHRKLHWEEDGGLV